MADCKRKLKKVNVQFISLVGAGANGKAILWKSADASENPAYEKTITIVKQDDEQRLVYGIVYSPDEVDSQGDTASAAVIKDMAYGFMKSRNTINVDKQHNGMSSEGYVAESWIVKTGDPVFASQPEGSWAVAIKVENDTTWNAVKSGEIGGLSLAGLAEIEEVAKTEAPAEDETEGAGIIQKIRQLLKLDADDQPVEKAGKAISAANAAKIKAAIDVLTELMGSASGQPDQSMMDEEIEMKKANEQTQTQEDPAMTQEELSKAIAEAMAPVSDSLKKMEEKITAIEKAQTEAADKIEKVSKSTDGSNQIKADEKKIEKIWT